MRRALPAAAIFAVLASGLVAQERIVADDTSVEPAVVTDHAVQVVPDAPVQKRLSVAADEAEEATDSAHAPEPVHHLDEGHLVAELGRTDVGPFSMLGVTWASGLGENSASTLVEVQTRGEDGEWTDWQEVHIEPAESGRPGTEPLWVGPSDAVAVRVLSDSATTVHDLQLSTIDPGETPQITPVAAGVGQPPIIMRSSWGAKAAKSCDSPRILDRTDGAVIHHTAGSNSYSKSESAAIVKATQSYHMDSRKWCDIGYNFLVDNYGQIFEGREGGVDQQVRGAHAGNGDVNKYMFGVSLMGTFTTKNPSSEMKTAVADLVAWRFSIANVPAKGTVKVGGKVYNRVSGHRDVVSTACPGATVYRWLSASGGLRDMVEDRLAGMPSYVHGIDSTDVGLTDATLTWNAVPDAVRYRVYVTDFADMPYTCEPNCEVVTPTDLQNPSWRLTGLRASTGYYVKISAIGADGHTMTDWQPNPTTFVTDVGGLRADEVGLSSFKLSWTAVPTAVQYRIYASPSSSMPSRCEPNCQVVTPSDLSNPSFTVTGLTEGAKYFVKISAIGADGRTMTDWQGEPLEVPLTSIPSVVQNVSGVAVSSTSMRVSWDAVPTAVQYRIYASPSSSMPSRCEPHCQVVTPSDLSDPSFTVTGLSAGKAYYVKVSAINAAGKTITGWQSSPVKVQLTASSVKDAVTIPSTRKIVVKGHGYGHGNGMSQYGAEGGARAGQKYDQILAHYYPGTELASRSGNIRVLITADTTVSVMINAASGVTFRQGGTSFVLPTTIDGKKVIRWSIDRDAKDSRKSTLRYRTSSVWQVYQNRVWTGDAQFEADVLSLVMPNDSARTYRSVLRSAVPSSGSTDRQTVNVLSLEDYTKGVIAREMPSSWHAEALKAQAVAARTYGVRGVKSTGYYDMCDTTSCQVYGGVAAETAASNAAVDATRGKILTYQGKPAFTQFSSSSGGYTNKGSQPYLTPIPDPWDGWSGNKNHAWTITVDAAKIEKANPTIGTLRSISITKRNGYGDMGGRVTSVKLTGSKATKTITGVAARWDFGLRSDWFGF